MRRDVLEMFLKHKTQTSGAIAIINEGRISGAFHRRKIPAAMRGRFVGVYMDELASCPINDINHTEAGQNCAYFTLADNYEQPPNWWSGTVNTAFYLKSSALQDVVKSAWSIIWPANATLVTFEVVPVNSDTVQMIITKDPQVHLLAMQKHIPVILLLSPATSNRTLTQQGEDICVYHGKKVRDAGRCVMDLELVVFLLYTLGASGSTTLAACLLGIFGM